MEAFITKNKKYFILEAPTGLGKSAIAYTVGQYMINFSDYIPTMETGPPIIVCTKTRNLQKQYIDSFGGLKSLWASSHYVCPLDPDNSECHYHSHLCVRKTNKKGDNCKYYRNAIQNFSFSDNSSEICLYKKANLEFMHSYMGILNYHFLLHSKKLSPKLLILDEAHNIEHILCDVMSINLTKNILNYIYRNAKKYQLLDCFNYNDFGLDDKKTFEDDGEVIKKVDDILSIKTCYMDNDVLRFENMKNEMKQMYTEIIFEIEQYNNVDRKKLSKEEKIRTNTLSKISFRTLILLDKLNGFLESNVEWVMTKNDNNENKSLNLKPLEIKEIVPVLLERAEKILFMSSTICGDKEFSKELLIKDNEYEFISLQSTISIKNRPIFSMNKGTLNYKNKKELFPKFIEEMDNLLKRMEEKHGTVRGLIHSVSYSNAKIIKESSKYSNRMIIPIGDQVLNIKCLLKSKKDIIIVSPSVLEGIDLKGDLARIQFFPKVPYLDLNDNWIKSKLKNNQKWYYRETIIRIVQGSGRSIRGDDDWAFTFILDSDFRRLLNLNKTLFPKWFLDAIVFLN